MYRMKLFALCNVILHIVQNISIFYFIFYWQSVNYDNFAL